MTATLVTSQTSAEFYAKHLPPAEEAAPVVETHDEDAKTEATDEKHEKPKKPIQPRINELVAQRKAAEAQALTEAQRANALARELDEIKARLDVLNTPAAQPEASAKPSRSQFATDDDYQEALTDWKVDKRLADRAKAESEARQQAVRAQLERNWTGRQEAFRADNPDYDEIVSASDVDIPDHLYSAIVESEMGPALAYYFAQHPAEVRKLMQMSPIASVKALAKLELEFAAPVDPGAKAKPVLHEKSRAPEPIETLRNASTPVEKDPGDMTQAEYRAWRVKNP